eukprot:2824833-Rhodomonas_salina.2
MEQRGCRSREEKSEGGRRCGRARFCSHPLAHHWHPFPALTVPIALTLTLALRNARKRGA